LEIKNLPKGVFQFD